MTSITQFDNLHHSLLKSTFLVLGETAFMLGILQPSQIEALLNRAIVGRLGCHAGGETYVTPISYAYDGTFIYCHTKNGKKIDMMRQNPSVCFQVDEMKNMANWESVIVQGTFEELIERDDRARALEALLNRYLPVISSITTHLGELWPFHPQDLAKIQGIVFRISIVQKTGRYESGQQSPHIPG